MLHLSINNKDVAFGINENIARNKVPYFVGVTQKEVRIKKLAKNLEVSEILPIFAPSECRQRARTICFHSNIQAGPF